MIRPRSLFGPVALLAVAVAMTPLPLASAAPAGDGNANDTAAIQEMIHRCAISGGGVVTLGAGTYRSGSLFLKSHVTLRLEKGAILKGSEDDKDYPTIDTRI